MSFNKCALIRFSLKIQFVILGPLDLIFLIPSCELLTDGGC